MIEPAERRRLLADAQLFRARLEATPSDARDAWVDAVLDVDAFVADEPLPRGCVPYLPCAVDVVLRALDGACVTSDDVFVDIGAGAGRVVALAQLLTGATAIGVELQPGLVRRARALPIPRLTFVEGDAAEPIVPSGSVYFLYCPFSGARLDSVLDQLETIARERPIRVCCVQLAPLDRPWLTRVLGDDELTIHRSV